jgi:phosphoglycerate dehydrogenase-like enzyme
MSLAELMRTSDVLLPAIVSNNETRGLITDVMLNNMKSTAIFISVVHEIYNHNLLLNLVETGKIYGYGFEESTQQASTYKGNVWAVPQMAWYTREAVEENARQWADSIVQATHSMFPNRVN